MYYNRIYIKRIMQGLDKKHLVILIGARRTGKTTIMKMIKEKIRDKKTIFIDVETFENLEIFGSYNTLTRYIELQGISNKDNAIIFLDEIQHIEGITNILKSVVDNRKNWKVLASGSSSIGILKNINESLAGRKRVIQIEGLTFNEFLHFRQMERLINNIYNIKNSRELSMIKDEILSLFDEYLIYGSMPEVILSENRGDKIEELKDISSSYIIKDIYRYFNRRINIVKYSKFIKLLANNSGKLTDISLFSRECELSRRETESILFILEEGNIIKRISPYYTNRNKSIIKAQKILFYDTGIRNSILFDFRKMYVRNDKGFIWEIAVFNNIKVLSKYNIMFFRIKSGSEIDFILDDGKQLIPIEVKSGDCRRVPISIKNFMKDNNCKNGYIINRTVWTEKNIDGFNVKIIPFFLIDRYL